MRLIPKQEAKRQRLKRYFTGKPCKHGHVSERWVSTGICVECSFLRNHQRWQEDSNYRDHARLAARTYGRAHSAEVVARVAAWRAANPGKRKVQDAAYRKRNRDKCRESNAKWRAKRPDYFKEWEARNVEICRAYRRNTKARRKAAPGRHTAADVAAIRSAQKGRCAYCRIRLDRSEHVDHVLPVALGGTNDRSNLQLLCPPCNLAKGAKHPVQYAREQGLLL